MELFPGDRTTICELIGCIAELSNRKYMAAQWQSANRFVSFEFYLEYIFDDFRLWDRVDVAPGYLGTYPKFGADLFTIGKALEEFENLSDVEARKSDLEILSHEEWPKIESLLVDFTRACSSWHTNNCDPKTMKAIL